MEVLSVTIFVIALFCYFIITIPNWAMARREYIDWSLFRRIKVGKLWFLFDFKNKNNVKEEGIITPFFIIKLKSYNLVIAIIIASIIYFIINFNVKDYTLVKWIGICFVVNFILDATILIVLQIISKKKIK